MAVINGDSSNNNLVGTALSDEIRGFDGNDSIAGLAGSDLIYGNQGNDRIDDLPLDADGNDTIYGGQGNDVIGTPGADGIDLIYGNFGNDVIEGGLGNDTIYGGQDNDELSGNNGNDLIYGNLGTDHLDGDAGNDTLYGGQGNEVELHGGAGNDVIYGNFGNDTLGDQLGAGDDTMYGGQDNDVLVSQVGDDQDRLFGNLGADTFDFATNNQTPPGGVVDADSDRIADFQTGVDKIALDLSDFTDNSPDYVEISAPGVTNVAEAITASTSAGATNNNEVIFVAGATDGYLLINASGSFAITGTDEFAIVLQGRNSTSSFDANDLIFV